MKKALTRFFAIIGLIAVLYVIVIVVVLVERKPSVGSKTVLEINLERPAVEYVPGDPLAQLFLKDKLVIRDTVDALDRAADDGRVAGLVARIGGNTLGMARTQEIRQAVQRFRAKGKFAYAFSETFGEVGPSNNSYYLATAFDQIYLQPSGDIGLIGFNLESPFLAGTLEKLGMRFRGDHRYEYKTALDLLTEKKYTPAAREADQRVIDSWLGQFKQGVADGRHIPADQFQGIVDRGPYLGQEAVDAKLVDRLAYRDQVYDDAKKKAGDGAKLLYLDKYLEAADRPHDTGKTIALIYGVGGVQRGSSSYDPGSGSSSMASDTVTAAIRAAVDDKEVKAILFRVDSPGGSYVASDAIWREVVRARQAGKPVVVSMGELAGSGGYFVAMAADKIVAQPGTITASIGVLGGKMLTSGLWDKLGLSWDEVHNGANALMWTGTHDFSPAEWARFQAWLDRVYADFTSKVADGRHLPKDKVLQIAKGRIWTGEDAKNIGLVDELGGYAEALALAKRIAQIPQGEEVHLEMFPRKKNPLSALLSPGAESGEHEAATQALVRTVETLQPVLRQLRALGVGAGSEEVLKMPDLSTK
jgi:protease IV